MNENAGKLDGKVAVITGAGRGIGRAIAVGFSEAGASVCCAARTEAQILDTARQIEQVGGRAMAKAADVTDFESVVSFFKVASRTFGGIDIVVINAGISIDKKPVAESVPEDWRKVIDVNLIGAYHTAKAAIPYLRLCDAGKIILIGSGLGHRGIPERSAYACSKAGLWMLTRVLAQELLPYRISVNELIPGPVQTAMTPENASKIRAQLGGSEWLKLPEDVVPLALFLAAQPESGPTAQSFSLMRRDS
ncbi:MAG: SDR family oxidoreductase [Chloroflexi bacterium]|nr:SDR family oxidoreductase [Chloroflexota bacterium]